MQQERFQQRVDQHQHVVLFRFPEDRVQLQFLEGHYQSDVQEEGGSDVVTQSVPRMRDLNAPLVVVTDVHPNVYIYD